MGIGCSGHAPEYGDDVALEGGEGGVGIAGKGDDALPECERFAGALGDAVEDGLASERFERGPDVVSSSFGNASGEDDEI